METASRQAGWKDGWMDGWMESVLHLMEGGWVLVIL